MDSTATVARGYTDDRRRVDAGEHTGDRGSHDRAGAEEHVADADVIADATNGDTLGDRHRQADTVGSDHRRVLDHGDRGGARRHRRAGHDADRFARADRPTGGGSRGRLAHHGQLGRGVDEIDGADGVPVDGAVVERRDVLARDHVGSQHEPEGRPSIDLDRRWCRASGPHQGLGLLQWDHPTDRIPGNRTWPPSGSG